MFRHRRVKQGTQTCSQMRLEAKVRRWMASLNVERAHERAIRSAMREVRRIWLETWRNGEPSPRSEMLRWRDRAWFKKVTARQNLRSGGTRKSYKATAHLRHAGSGVRHAHEDVLAAVLGDGWKRSCLDNEELWTKLEDFVIWQTCLRCQLPTSPGVESEEENGGPPGASGMARVHWRA